MFDRLLRRLWLLGIPVGLLGAAAVIAYARPWHDSAPPVREVKVEQATLRPGAIVLVVVNNSLETARVAQVILNDAFVDFRQALRQRVARLRADHAALDERQRIAAFLPNYSITRDGGARIDPKDHDGS